jgi:GAF domain-containing protein
MSLNNKEYKWTEDDVDIAEAVAERLSLAIETAALLRTAQHRADIEKVTTDISTKIGSSSRFETILQTAAQELSKALGGSDVLVQIEPVALKLGMTE